MLRRMADLSEDQSGQLIANLSAPGVALPVDLRTALRESVEGVDENDSRETISSLLSLAVASIAHSYSAADVAEAVATSPTLGLEDEKATRFRDFLSAFLSIEAVRMFAKSVDLLQERDHLGYLFRIISDLRPLFDEQISAPSGAVILHELRIVYYENGQSQSFAVSLDLADLLSLREAVERAIEKHDVLSALVADSGITDLTGVLEEDSD
jgi:hypothetical protein